MFVPPPITLVVTPTWDALAAPMSEAFVGMLSLCAISRHASHASSPTLCISRPSPVNPSSCAFPPDLSFHPRIPSNVEYMPGMPDPTGDFKPTGRNFSLYVSGVVATSLVSAHPESCFAELTSLLASGVLSTLPKPMFAGVMLT